jgi:hypothetical protein
MNRTALVLIMAAMPAFGAVPAPTFATGEDGHFEKLQLDWNKAAEKFLKPPQGEPRFFLLPPDRFQQNQQHFVRSFSSANPQGGPTCAIPLERVPINSEMDKAIRHNVVPTESMPAFKALPVCSTEQLKPKH